MFIGPSRCGGGIGAENPTRRAQPLEMSRFSFHLASVESALDPSGLHYMAVGM